MAKPQRRSVTPLLGEVRPQKRFCPLQTCSPYSKPSQPPLGAWRAGRVHPHLFSVWQLGDALSFPRYSPSFRRRRAACLGTQSILPCSVRTCRGFTTTGRGQTAKAFLPASNVLSSLKTVTATPRGLACGSSSSSFILGLAVGGRIVFPLLQSVLSPPADRVWGHSRFSPAAFGPRAGHLSVQHFTLHQPGHGRQGLSFVAEGAAAHDSVRLHISVWGISPPPRRGFN